MSLARYASVKKYSNVFIYKKFKCFYIISMNRKYHITAKHGLLTSDITIVIEQPMPGLSYFSQLVCHLHREFEINMDDVLKIELLEV